MEIRHDNRRPRPRRKDLPHPSARRSCARGSRTSDHFSSAAATSSNSNTKSPPPLTCSSNGSPRIISAPSKSRRETRVRRRVCFARGPPSICICSRTTCIFPISWIASWRSCVVWMDRKYRLRNSPDSVVFLYAWTSKGSKLRRYVVELAVYLVHNQSQSGNALVHSELMSGMGNEDFFRDYLHLSAQKIDDPRRGSGCRFHMHEEHEVCRAKFYGDEGKDILLGHFEQKVMMQNRLAKKQRLSPGPQSEWPISPLAGSADYSLLL
ncbi:hypothetical protein NHQ30_008941 [Ciborinia camelliae]|nr:hypothetical protein NHQ30_008941 [Ciborinia camelliae]